ncbi:piggyBac transposable element-derived protein 4-like [Frieseomelitta varia]|uniref:piggyBac transposable element-derived protein 4-like n=1 Tax=Frieseomelitta varia TaxID=561572 RepID=UPI001CB6B395|nr:piggyBac transposable element-derived protein 4-like [Frieseomelitta varia]
MKNWDNEMVRKNTCKHDTSDSCSDSEETSDFEMPIPFYKRIIKKRRVLTESESDSSDSLESEENKTEVTSKQKKRENTFSWTQGDFQPVIHEFDDKNSGIKASVNRQSSILDIFQIFFSEELIEFIVEQSNKYYENDTRGDVYNSNVTTVSEMYNFLAVSMLMARIHKTSLSEYWSKDKLIRTESFGEIMSRDRYTLLLKILHFCDNNNENYDPIIKIRHILEKLKTSFKTAFYPYEKLCIDESLLLFKGRCYFKQCVPSKRSRFEIKSFVLCDNKTGYIQDLIVYSGANMMSEDIASKSIGKSGQIVMTLLEPYLGKGHTLVTDNWYSSPSLFLELHKNLTNAYGTVRKNKLGIPELNKNINEGEYIFCSTKNVLALKWMDKREVWMISTYHCPNMIDTNKIHYQTKEKIIKPQCIIDYNKTMRAVDKVDQILYTLNYTRKGLEWYKKFFFHLFDLAVYNTFILYNCVTGRNLSFSKFHLYLIKQILRKYSSGRTHTCKSKGKSIDNEPFRLTQMHFPSPYVNNAAIRKNARRKCIVCRKHDRRSETHYECKKCDVGLCIYPCFEMYHTLLDY